MTHLRVLAKAPHPIGSSAQVEAKNHLIKTLSDFGLIIDQQKADVLRSLSETRPADASNRFVAGRVENVVAKLEGKEKKNAVLIIAHYDSVPNGPGASDNASSVAAILESIRALRSGPPLKNDLVFLFSDGEEVGLLGTKAFIENHPWAKEVRMAINLDARGNRGPLVLFETSRENGWLITEYSKAAPSAVASSLFYEIYKLLLYDTDLTVMKNAGYAGLNLALVQGAPRYHNMLDTPANIDERSIQHQGENLLLLAHHFGGLDLGNAKGGDRIYFNLVNRMISYPETWAPGLAVVLMIAFAAVVAAGLWRKSLTLAELGLGSLAFLSTLISTQIVLVILLLVIRSADKAFQWMPGETYNSGLYKIGFVSLAIALTTSIGFGFGRKIRVESRLAGSLFWWMLLAVITSLVLKGASYLFLWPASFGLAALAALVIWHPPVLKRSGVLLLATLPAIIVVVPTVFMIIGSVSPGLIGLALVPLILIVDLLVIQGSALAVSRIWWVPATSLVAGLVLIGFGIGGSRFDYDHPKPNNLSYLIDADSGQAMWISADRKSDQWTSEYVGADSERTPLKEYFPFTNRTFLTGDAGTVSLPAPHMTVLENEEREGLRRLQLKVASLRQARCLRIYLEAGEPLRLIGIADDESNRLVTSSATMPTADSRTKNYLLELIYYAAGPEGLVFSVETRSAKVQARVIDQSDGLPLIQDQAIKPRPNHMTAGVFNGGDSTFVSRSFSF